MGVDKCSYANNDKGVLHAENRTLKIMKNCRKMNQIEYIQTQIKKISSKLNSIKNEIMTMFHLHIQNFMNHNLIVLNPNFNINLLGISEKYFFITVTQK